jgi:hypothetical protein
MTQFKNKYFLRGSPLSIYSPPDQIDDIYVLGSGEVFDDEISHDNLNRNPCGLYMITARPGQALIQTNLLEGNPNVINVYDFYRTNEVPFIATVHDQKGKHIVVTVEDPYKYHDPSTGSNRPLMLSDVFNIVKERIRTEFVISQPMPVSLTGNALEQTVSKYMERHLVFISTTCRCFEDESYCRTASTQRPESSIFPLAPTASQSGNPPGPAGPSVSPVSPVHSVYSPVHSVYSPDHSVYSPDHSVYSPVYSPGSPVNYSPGSPVNYSPGSPVNYSPGSPGGGAMLSRRQHKKSVKNRNRKNKNRNKNKNKNRKRTSKPHQ